MMYPLPARVRQRSAGKTHLLTPILLLGLLCAASASWFAVTETATAHAHVHAGQWQEAPHVPLDAVHPDDRPKMNTQAFLPSAVSVGTESKTVYLYASRTTTRYFASAGGNYTTLLKPWRQFFRQRGYRYVETARIPETRLAPDAVLVLPSTVALDKQERQQLIAFHHAGGSILATSATGVRDADGTWQGHALLNDLFGVQIVGEIAPESSERFLNLFGETPLTMGYPAGRHFWLENTSERALRMVGGHAAASYMDWARTTDSFGTGAAVVFDEHGNDKNRARWAVFGFAETSWGAQSDELAGLLDNTLHWLSRGVLVAKAAWPAPYRAAYLLEMDTEDGFANARHFARMMDAHGLRGTFYSLTSEAVRYPLLVRELARRHEIGFHGEVHNGFRGQSPAEQGQRLQRMLADMKGIVGDRVETTGFRAPREEYDRATEQLLEENGFLHHAADPNRTEARLPFIAQTGASNSRQRLVVLPRTQDDDISLRANESGPQAERRLSKALHAQFENVQEMGALGVLSIHSQYFEDDSALHAVMPDFLRSIVQSGRQVWIAPGREIAAWWRQRERVQHRVSGSSDQFRVELTVSGDGPVEHASLIFAHRQSEVPVQLKQLDGPAIKAEMKKIDSHRSSLAFERLEPGTYAFHVQATPHGAPPDGHRDVIGGSVAEREVLDAARRWAQAWSAQDIDGYFSAYSQALALPKGTSRQQWEDTRRARILEKASIRVDIVSPKVELEGNQARLTFRQVYKAGKIRLDERKMLRFEREGGVWRIQKEAVTG